MSMIFVLVVLLGMIIVKRVVRGNSCGRLPAPVFLFTSLKSNAEFFANLFDPRVVLSRVFSYFLYEQQESLFHTNF